MLFLSLWLLMRPIQPAWLLEAPGAIAKLLLQRRPCRADLLPYSGAQEVSLNVGVHAEQHGDINKGR
ncbi:unnamed protein product [Gadus morhua 'NCC']